MVTRTALPSLIARHMSGIIRSALYCLREAKPIGNIRECRRLTWKPPSQRRLAAHYAPIMAPADYDLSARRAACGVFARHGAPPAHADVPGRRSGTGPKLKVSASQPATSGVPCGERRRACGTRHGSLCRRHAMPGIRPITAASSMSAIKRRRPPHRAQSQHVKPEGALHQRRPQSATSTRCSGTEALEWGEKDSIRLLYRNPNAPPSHHVQDPGLQSGVLVHQPLGMSHEQRRKYIRSSCSRQSGGHLDDGFIFHFIFTNLLPNPRSAPCHFSRSVFSVSCLELVLPAFFCGRKQDEGTNPPPESV